VRLLELEPAVPEFPAPLPNAGRCTERAGRDEDAATEKRRAKSPPRHCAGDVRRSNDQPERDEAPI